MSQCFFIGLYDIETGDDLYFFQKKNFDLATRSAIFCGPKAGTFAKSVHLYHINQWKNTGTFDFEMFYYFQP